MGIVEVLGIVSDTINIHFHAHFLLSIFVFETQSLSVDILEAEPGGQ